MVNLLKCLFFILSATVLMKSPMEPVQLKGSLVIAINTTGGLLIASDKRTYDLIRGKKDNNTKIKKLGKFSAYSVTGTPEFLNPKTFATMWSVYKVLDTFNLLDDPISPNNLTPLAQNIISSFEAFLASLDYKSWPQTANSSDDALFQVVFFQYQKSIQNFKIQTIKFQYKKQYPKPEMTVYYFDEKLSSSHILGFGNNAVYFELVKGRNKKFDSLRRNSEIKRFILDTLDHPLVSVSRAVKFSEFYMKKCSQLTELIDSSKHYIGPTPDIALIDKKDGFKWLIHR